MGHTLTQIDLIAKNIRAPIIRVISFYQVPAGFIGYSPSEYFHAEIESPIQPNKIILNTCERSVERKILPAQFAAKVDTRDYIVHRKELRRIVPTARAFNEAKVQHYDRSLHDDCQREGVS